MLELSLGFSFDNVESMKEKSQVAIVGKVISSETLIDADGLRLSGTIPSFLCTLRESSKVNGRHLLGLVDDVDERKIDDSVTLCLQDGDQNRLVMLQRLLKEGCYTVIIKQGGLRKNYIDIAFVIIYGLLAWFIIPCILIFSLLHCLKIIDLVKHIKQLTVLRKSGVPKKKKARKHRTIVVSCSDNECSGFGRVKETQFDKKCLFFSCIQSIDAGNGRWVGKLFVSNIEIGRGNNGTVVFEGFYDGRLVAVKRLLCTHNDVARREIENLIVSDQHPNIVRLYGVEQDLDFIYISLERCSCSLADLIQYFSKSSTEGPTSNSEIEISVQLNYLKGIEREMELWRRDGLPSKQLLKLMRDVVSGLGHLHELGIIHRDLKPQNVLISSDGIFKAKLSDMGISKRLRVDMSSFSHHSTGYGSSGWQSPEQLLHRRQTRALDLFSLGCVLFYCITKGGHPFGDHFERDVNILNNRLDLFLVDYIPEAVHLLSQLLDPDHPEMRPKAAGVLGHPLFWSAEKRLAFLREASDRIDKAIEIDLLIALENVAPSVFGRKWGKKLDAVIIAHMSRHRKHATCFIHYESELNYIVGGSQDLKKGNKKKKPIKEKKEKLKS